MNHRAAVVTTTHKTKGSDDYNSKMYRWIRRVLIRRMGITPWNRVIIKLFAHANFSNWNAGKNKINSFLDFEISPHILKGVLGSLLYKVFIFNPVRKLQSRTMEQKNMTFSCR